MALRMPRIHAACMLLGAIAASGAAQAQASVQLYGLVDAWVGMQKKVGGHDRDWTQGGGGMTTSHWGLRGAEELGGGLSAVFAVEGFFRPQIGEYGRFRGDDLFSRNAYVGLKSEQWGTLKLGRVWG